MLWVHTNIIKKTKYGLREGMTLIEVIIAIALMGIIVIGILTALTNQVTLLNKSKSITVDSFSNQLEVEEVIEAVKTNPKFSVLSTWRDTISDYSSLPNRNDKIVKEGKTGKLVDLYKVELNDSKGKNVKVLLSPSLASDQKQNMDLEAQDVEILVNNVRNIEVAALSSLPTVSGRYIINGTNYYTTICKWYASIPGVINPQWPHDYEQIVRKVQEAGYTPNHATLNLINLSDYANRYVIFSAQPVDGNGIRGTEIISKKILVLGAEWRDGNYPWADKNSNNFFDGFAIDKDAQLQYSMIEGILDYKTLEVNISDVEKMDIKNSSLFVPRAIGGRKDYTGNDFEKDIITNNAINWSVEKAIHFANKIITTNSVSLKTEDGQIVMYRFVEIDSSGKAILDAEGYRLKNPGTLNFEQLYSFTPKLYQNIGSEIISESDVYLGAYGIGRGFIYLQPFSSISGKNLILEAEEPITVYNSALVLVPLAGDTAMMNREILLTSIKDISIRSLAGFTPNYIKGNPLTKSTIKFNTNQNVLVENAVFKDIDISLLGNGIFKDVIWDSTKSITVKDGKTLTFSKTNHEKVKNNGILNLGDTGGVSATGFTDANNMFENPIGFIINTTANNNEIQLSTTNNLIRNIGYADYSSETVLTANYQPLGAGNTNLDIKLDSSVANLRYSFDGTNKITVVADELSLGQSAQSTITIRDRYAPIITKNIKVLITGGTNGNSYTFQQ